MSESLKALMDAESKAAKLFEKISEIGLIVPGKTERELNEEVYALAADQFGIKKYWHKRIVRSGRNTLLPYRENPPDLILQDDDILFFDFGPVFDEWEADFGRTYVIGSNKQKLKLMSDVESAWVEGKNLYDANKLILRGMDFYNFTKKLAKKYGWEFGNIHCGHLIGNFPHEVVLGEEIINYIHPENDTLMNNPDKFGNERFWIYEIHFIDKTSDIGGFFEQLLS